MSERESLKDPVGRLLDEARMILPGIQTLFGFQLIAILNDSFTHLLAPDVQLIHLASLLTVLAAAGAVIAPAAYQRLAEPDTSSFVQVASKAIGLGLFLLMAGLALEVFVVGLLILRSVAGASALALAVCVGLGAMWFALPLASRSEVEA